MGRNKKPIPIGGATIEEPIKIVEIIKEKIYVIDDHSTEYQQLCKQYGQDYDLQRCRAEKETDTLYDIIATNIKGNPHLIKFFLHYCREDYEDDPMLNTFVNKLRHEFKDKVSIFKAYENHDRKTIGKMI